MSLPSLIPLGAGVAGALAGRGIADSSRGQSFLEVLQSALLPGNRTAQDSPQVVETDIAGKEVAGSGKDRSELVEEMAELSRRLLQRFAAAGIDLTIPIELRSDGFGGVIVDDPHPQRTEIERLIAADRELTDAFQSVSAAYTADDAARTAAGGNRWSEFRLKLDPSGGRVLFE